MKPRVCFVVESGTDVRLVEALHERTRLTILARRLPQGQVISQPPGAMPAMELGPPGHAAFAAFVLRRLRALRTATDVVLVQGYGPTAAAANLAGRLSGVPVMMLVCSPLEAYYRCRKREDSPRRFSAIEYAAIRTFAKVNARLGRRYIVLSPHLASVVRAHGGSADVDVIPVYGVDRRIFTPSTEDRRALRARLGLPPDDALVFFSSRVAPEKDAATVLLALRTLLGEGRSVRVLHLSGGHREFASLAASIGVGGHVIARDAVAPFVPLADHYRASDVCVQASREEGLGFSPLEALACGVPVVASAVGGLTDTIRDHDTGWPVPAGDPRALAGAIGQVLDDPPEAARRAARGAALVDRTYERQLVFDALDDVLRSVTPAGLPEPTSADAGIGREVRT